MDFNFLLKKGPLRADDSQLMILSGLVGLAQSF